MDSKTEFDPIPSWQPVQGSTNISGFAYIQSGDLSAYLGTLFIRFSNGGEYKYESFPAQLAEDFFGSESKGAFFHRNIRANYSGVKLVPVPKEAEDDAT